MVVGKDRNVQPATNKQYSVSFKNGKSSSTKEVKNYYKDEIYKHSGENIKNTTGKPIQPIEDVNPYMQLLRDSSKLKNISMNFSAADFSYLTDLGVYPINRLWILRRFNDYSNVPDNLQMWAGKSDYNSAQSPISTLVGWIKPDQDSFFSVSFIFIDRFWYNIFHWMVYNK